MADELRVAMSAERVDVLLLQEPYTLNGKVCGFSVSDRVYAVGGPGDDPMAAVVLRDARCDAVLLSDLSSPTCACVHLSSCDFDLYVLSVYFRHGGNIEDDLAHLGRALCRLQGRRVIVGGDVNAESELWHGRESRSDRERNRMSRGEILKDFIARWRLGVINGPGQTTTFSTANGESTIDVSLATNNVFPFCRGWRVRDDWTSSDHQVITWRIGGTPGRGAAGPVSPPRFAIGRANWPLFEGVLRRLWDLKETNFYDLTRDNVSSAVTEITSILSRTMGLTIPRVRNEPPRKGPVWWTPDLARTRGEYFALRKRAQRATDGECRARLFRELNRVKAAYKRAIRSEKRRSWRAFLTKEGERTPWGLGYRIYGESLQPETLLATVRTGEASTLTYRDTLTALMDSLVPGDDPSEDTAYHQELRGRMSTPPDTEDNDDPVDLEEVTDVVMRLKRRKAPGPDGIPVEVIRRAWPTIGEDVTRLFAGCVELGLFPDAWKRGRVAVIRKAGDRDPSLVGSYRPICLLPVIGKIYERLVTRRLVGGLNHAGGLSANQFGFVRGKSTEDALLAVAETIANHDERYVLGIFLDIQGAFDNIWWPYVLNALKLRGCDRDLYCVLLDYFRDRTMEMTSRSETVVKTATKGCPQGSVAGPTLWNVAVDGALAERTEAGETKIAFADDLLIIVAGNSRLDLETKANTALSPLLQWAQEAKLRFSPAKSEMMLLKGTLDVRRPPTVRIAGRQLRLVRTVKYLGLLIQERFRFTDHVKAVTDKAKSVCAKLGRLAGSGWGYRGKTLLTLYKGVIVPRLTYGAVAWAEDMHQQDRNRLLSAQRAALLRILGAYSTTPTDSLPVLAGVLPMDLKALEVLSRSRLKRGLGLRIGRLLLTSQELEDNRDTAALRVTAELGRLWQTRWTNSEHGRWTYRLLPSVKVSKNMLYWTPGKVCQMLTGHGDFRGYLRRFGLADRDDCACGEPETAEHLLLSCPIHELKRMQLRLELEQAYPGAPFTTDLLTRKRSIRPLVRFIRGLK